MNNKLYFILLPLIAIFFNLNTIVKAEENLPGDRLYANEYGECPRFDDEMGPGKGYHFKKGYLKGGRMVFGNLERMKEDLNLNKTQVEKISKINKSFYDKYKSLRDKIYPLQKQLSDELLKESIDLPKVEKLLKGISELKVESQLLRIKHRIAIENELTKEQKNKLKEIKKEHRDRFKEKFRGKPGPHGPMMNGPHHGGGPGYGPEFGDM